MEEKIHADRLHDRLSHAHLHHHLRIHRHDLAVRRLGKVDMGLTIRKRKLPRHHKAHCPDCRITEVETLQVEYRKAMVDLNLATAPLQSMKKTTPLIPCGAPGLPPEPLRETPQDTQGIRYHLRHHRLNGGSEARTENTISQARSLQVPREVRIPRPRASAPTPEVEATPELHFLARLQEDLRVSVLLWVYYARMEGRKKCKAPAQPSKYCSTPTRCRDCASRGSYR